MEWIFYVGAGVFIVGGAAGVIQLVQKIKNERYRNTCKAILFLTSIPLSIYLCFVAMVAYAPERIEIVDGRKFLVQTRSFLFHSDEFYFEYVNLFVQEKSAELVVYF